MTKDREDIEISGPDGKFTGYLAVPANPNAVSVVVLQEIFGVNSNIREITDRLADAGYVGIAPDLYWRQKPKIQLDPATDEGRQQAMELMKTLDRDEAVRDGVAALSAASNHVSGIKHTAALGYCFGGGIAYLMAARNNVDIGIAYYGTHIHAMLNEADVLKGELLLHIAGEDHLCPPEAQNNIEISLEHLGSRANVVIHSGVGHAFAREGGSAYDKNAAARANAMTLDALRSLVES